MNIDAANSNSIIAENMNDGLKHAGIGAVLRGEIEISQALTTVDVGSGKLQVLYGGEPEPQTARLLGAKVMEELLSELKKKADIVILDTAPSELLADATALAKYVDAALYVVKCDYAKKNRIRNGVQSLDISGIKILGYVFNADRSKRSGGYGYGYKRYSGYYGYGYYGNRKDDISGRVIKD